MLTNVISAGKISPCQERKINWRGSLGLFSLLVPVTRK